MGRKKKHKKPHKRERESGRAAPAQGTGPDVAAVASYAPSGDRVRFGGRSPRLLAAGLVVGVGVVLWTVLLPPARSTEFPPPPAVATAGAPTLEDFAGADACAECHEPEYNAWRASTHGRAGGLPSEDLVIVPFDGRPIRFRDAVVVPSVTSSGDYVFTVRQDGFSPVVIPVTGVVGGGHMVGGGTQGFLTAFDDGTLRFLPFDFIRQEGVWFCNTNTRTGEGWVPITEQMLLADCGDWPPVRVFGTAERFGNCQECHGSQVTIALGGEGGRYETRVRSLAINCESCHGPAQRHVELAQARELDGSVDLGVRSLGLLDEDASLEVCFQCHALKESIEPGYLPGKPLQDHYSLLATLVGERPFFADGRIATFAYQINHLASDCYLNGTMNCVDCHEPHGQGYWDTLRRPMEGRFSDEQCTSCHPSKAVDIESHTFHPAGSEGSRCVGCHMPYLQHQELGDQLRFARSDHTIPIPRPAFDEELGVRNACLGCHQNSTVAELQRVTNEWYGAIKPHKPIVTGILRAQRGETVDPAAELLHPDLAHPMAQVAAMTLLIENHLSPDMTGLDSAVRRGLERLAGNENIDVRAVALASLHYALGDDEDVRRLLVDRVTAAVDERALRERWVLTLGYYGDTFRERGNPTTAILVYGKALEVLPEHAGILRNMGLAYNALRDFPTAIRFFDASLAVDMRQALTLVNRGIALEGLQRDSEAAADYRRAIEANPAEPLAYFNLGNFHLRRDEYQEAIAQYRLAVVYDPGLALGHFYLGRALVMVNDLAAALPAARKAVEFDPTNQGARDMVAELERVLGNAR